MRPPRDWRFPILDIEKCTDGDTYWLRVDLGLREERSIEVRLHGWDCPEMRQGTPEERTAGTRARQVAEDWWTQVLLTGDPWIRTEKDTEKYGRWLGEVYDAVTGIRLGDRLAAQGLAVRYPGKWRDTYLL